MILVVTFKMDNDKLEPTQQNDQHGKGSYWEELGIFCLENKKFMPHTATLRRMKSSLREEEFEFSCVPLETGSMASISASS